MTKQECQTMIAGLLTECGGSCFDDPPVRVEQNIDGFCMTCGDFSIPLPVNSWCDAYYYTLGAVNGSWLPEILRNQHRDQVARREHEFRQKEDYNRCRQAFVEQSQTLVAILVETTTAISDVEAGWAAMDKNQIHLFAVRIYNLFKPIQKSCENFAWWSDKAYPGDEANDSFEYMHAGDYDRNYGINEDSSWPELLTHTATVSIPNILKELENGDFHEVAMRSHEIYSCLKNKISWQEYQEYDYY